MRQCDVLRVSVHGRLLPTHANRPCLPLTCLQPMTCGPETTSNGKMWCIVNRRVACRCPVGMTCSGGTDGNAWCLVSGGRQKQGSRVLELCTAWLQGIAYT